MNAIPTAANSKTANSKAVCSHCDLPVPPGLIDRDQQNQFCCNGCRMAYQLIHEHGLEDYYALARQATGRAATPPKNASSEDRRFDSFDLPEFHDRFVKGLPGGINEGTLVLDGIHCAACLWLIEKLPQMLNGVLWVQVNWARRSARIRWNPSQVSLSRIATTLDRLGYRPHPQRDSTEESLRNRENRKQLARIGIAAAAAGNNMIIAAALYLGMFSYMSMDMTRLLRVASCLVGLVSLLGPGRVFLRSAWSAFRTRTPHMDLPIALALTAGMTAGVINTIRDVGEIYFDSLSVLVFLLLVGRYVQFRQQSRAVDAVALLYRLTPARARKVIDGKVIDTFAELVKPGDVLEVRNGETLPADAMLIEGTALLDESLLSGESRPVRKSPGDDVLAGTQNLNQTIRVRATATGNDTRLAKMIELVEQASQDRPKIVQWAHRIGGYFVVVVTFLAALTFLHWWPMNLAAAVDRTVALLIIACPCALAMATPLALAVAIGRAARRKIMIKGGDVLQLMERPGILWLDKTGTITDGELDVARWHGDRSVIPAVVALENESSHPVAVALVRSLSGGRPNPRDQIHNVTHYRNGISGQVAGAWIVIGSEARLRQREIHLAEGWQAVSRQLLNAQLTPCWIAVDGEVVAIAGLSDHIRPESREAVEQIRNRGWRVGILSGDHPAIVRRVARQLRIPEEWAKGGLLPEEKLAMVRQSSNADQTVVMVGDGVNDSASLAAASVGIAVHNSAEASLAAAPVYLAEQGLMPLLELMDISRSTRRIMRLNLAISLAYNTAGAALAFAGWIHPLLAAILMPVSSLTVVAISLASGSGVARHDSFARRDSR